MKKGLYYIILFLLPVLAQAQSGRFQPFYLYGNEFQRVKIDSALLIPAFNDTLLHSIDTSAQIRIINGQLMYHYGTWHNAGAATVDLSGYYTTTQANSLFKPLNYQPSWSDVLSKPTFAAVAFSGSYWDLDSLPTLSTDAQTLQGKDSGFYLNYNNLHNLPAAASTNAATLQGKDTTFLLNYYNLHNIPNLSLYELQSNFTSDVQGIGDARYLRTYTESDPLSVHTTDSAAMLSPYLRKTDAAGTYLTNASISGKVNVSDTATMLSHYELSAHATGTYVAKVTGKDLSTNDYTTTEKTKLAGIATGATANSTDAYLLSRANQTGTQLSSTISDFTTAVQSVGDARYLQSLSSLSTTNLSEGTNLYFTNARAIAAPLTGFAASSGTITATDNILTAIEKNAGNIPTSTSQIAASTNKNYVTDAQLTVIGNTSGTNTGDETSTTIKTKLGITTLSGSNTGDETNSTILSKLGISSISGTNTGDETATSIKTKLGITTLSGSNTGDQDLSGYLLSTTAASTYQPIGTYATASNTMTFTNKSGNVSQWTNDAGFIAASNYIVREQPSGTYNGSNTTFTLSHSPATGKEMIFKNGVLQYLTDDYIISGSTITMAVAPRTTDKIRVTYIY